MESKLLYAVMQDNEDSDWGTGSFDRAEAIEKAKSWRDGGDYPDAHVAVIDVSDEDPTTQICVEEIRDFD